MGQITSSLDELQLQQRKQKALALREAGVKPDRIAAELGVSVSQAYRDIKEALNANIDGLRETNQDRREININRLELLIRKLMPFVVSGEGKQARPNTAVAREIRECISELNKLLGLYAPQININVEVDTNMIAYMVSLMLELGGDPNTFITNTISQLEYAKEQRRQLQSNVISITAQSKED